MQSPIIIDIEVELVGAKFNGQASIGFLYKIPTVEFLCKVLFELLVILISLILNKKVLHGSQNKKVLHGSLTTKLKEK